MFDVPEPTATMLAFEKRYKFLLLNLTSDHPFMISFLEGEGGGEVEGEVEGEEIGDR